MQLPQPPRHTHDSPSFGLPLLDSTQQLQQGAAAPWPMLLQGSVPLQPFPTSVPLQPFPTTTLADDPNYNQASSQFNQSSFYSITTVNANFAVPTPLSTQSTGNVSPPTSSSAVHSPNFSLTDPPSINSHVQASPHESTATTLPSVASASTSQPAPPLSPLDLRLQQLQQEYEQLKGQQLEVAEIECFTVPDAQLYGPPAPAVVQRVEWPPRQLWQPWQQPVQPSDVLQTQNDAVAPSTVLWNLTGADLLESPVDQPCITNTNGTRTDFSVLGALYVPQDRTWQLQPEQPAVNALIHSAASSFQGGQRQIILGLLDTISNLTDGNVNKEKKKSSIIGDSRFDAASLALRTMPAIFLFPGHTQEVQVDLGKAMAGYSQQTKASRKSIGNFVKHVLQKVYAERGASVQVTAACERSTKGYRVLPQSSIRTLANFWLAHFNSSCSHSVGEVEEYMAIIIKTYLDRNRRVGRREGS